MAAVVAPGVVKVAHADDRDDGGDALRGALDLTRERLVFQYEAGALLVTDLAPLASAVAAGPMTTGAPIASRR